MYYFFSLKNISSIITYLLPPHNKKLYNNYFTDDDEARLSRYLTIQYKLKEKQLLTKANEVNMHKAKIILTHKRKALVVFD